MRRKISKDIKSRFKALKKEKDRKNAKDALTGLLNKSSFLKSSMHEKDSFVKKEHKFYEQIEDFDRENYNNIDFVIIKNYNEELCHKLHLEVPSYPFWEKEKDEHIDKFIRLERM